MKTLKFSTLISIIFHLFLFHSAKAQSKGGKWFFGGNSNLNFVYSELRSENYQGDSWVFTLNPKVGRLITNKWIIGVELPMRYDYSKVIISSPPIPTQTIETSNSSFGAGIFTRAYFGSQVFRPFAELSTGINKTESESSEFSFTKISYLSYGRLNIGLAYFIQKNLSIGFDIGIMRTWLSIGSGDKGPSLIFPVNIGFSLFL